MHKFLTDPKVNCCGPSSSFCSFCSVFTTRFMTTVSSGKLSALAVFKVIICLWFFTDLQHYGNIHVWFDSTTELSVYSLPNILTAGPTSSCVTQLSLKKPFQNTCSGQDWVIQEGEKWRIGCRWGENYWLINFPF